MQINNIIRLVPSAGTHGTVTTLHPDSTVPNSTDGVTVIRLGRVTAGTQPESERYTLPGGWNSAAISAHHCDI